MNASASKNEEMVRKFYLNSKGINSKQPFQLALLFPDIIGKRPDLRHIPNDVARTSLYTARNKSEPRKTLLHEKLFSHNENVSILYSGIELRAEDDELVWLQILSYGRNVPFGEPFEFCVKDLVHDVGWSKNGRNYDRARECISRLKANEVLALNKKAYGKSESFSLIQNYTVINDAKGKPTEYRVWIDPNLILLFAGNTFTSHIWEVYRKLSPVARRLVDYIQSHSTPYPLAMDRFRLMCGCHGDTTPKNDDSSQKRDKTLASWRQTVNRACDEVQKTKIASVSLVGHQIFSVRA